MSYNYIFWDLETETYWSGNWAQQSISYLFQEEIVSQGEDAGESIQVSSPIGVAVSCGVIETISVMDTDNGHGTPGPRLNIKTVFSTYGDFHVKDKTAVRTSYL